MDEERLTTLTADIASAFVSGNTIAASDIPTLIQNIGQSLKDLGGNPSRDPSVPEPLTKQEISKSKGKDYVRCLECQKKMKSLKRHLMTSHGMTADAYKARWGLPKSYTLVSPAYADERRQMAVALGLGKGERSRHSKR